MMTLRPAIFKFVGALILFSSACGPAPKTPAALTVNEAASTLVALTFQAATQSVRLSTPTPAGPGSTPTSAKALLYINDNTQCRTGTSPNFKTVAGLSMGSTVELIGKDAAQSAWLIRAPNGTDTCWVLTGDGSPSGDYEDLPEVTPQPSTQKPPSVPAIVGWPWFCTYSNGVIYKATVSLSWIDPARDANGFRVYRQDTLIADIPATTTSITDTTNVIIGSDLTYGLEAYNDAGLSARKTITIHSICK
ncbi:MAG TPA: hypothetical protein VLZ89_05450 [Anaerolineales bacterium]|nr:hypothetical protein [Anaerolineales bacterium]